MVRVCELERKREREFKGSFARSLDAVSVLFTNFRIGFKSQYCHYCHIISMKFIVVAVTAAPLLFAIAVIKPNMHEPRNQH